MIVFHLPQFYYFHYNNLCQQKSFTRINKQRYSCFFLSPRLVAFPMSQTLLSSSFQQQQQPYQTVTFCFRQQTYRTFICQLLGTAILITGICCTTYSNPVNSHKKNTVMLHDLYVLVCLYMARIMFAPLTGGYFNTALTLGVFLNKNSRNKISLKRLGVYVSGQVAGAIIGVTISKLVYDVNVGPFDSLIPYPPNEVVIRCFGQLIGSTVFVLMVLILTTSDTTFISQQCWMHLFVPIFLYGGRKMSKYINGLNPEEMISTQMVTSLFTQNGNPAHVGYVFAIAGAQLLGGVLAATFFNFVYHPMLLKWRSQE